MAQWCYKIIDLQKAVELEKNGIKEKSFYV